MKTVIIAEVGHYIRVFSSISLAEKEVASFIMKRVSDGWFGIDIRRQVIELMGQEDYKGVIKVCPEMVARVHISEFIIDDPIPSPIR